MYSETDLEAAVAAGALTPAAAQAFRDHVAAQRRGPAVDEESFRLLTGFNDIFVAIALVLLLVALAWLGGAASPALGGALVAGASWGLAEFFTRRRRMALPSILLLLSFTGGVAATLLGALFEASPDLSDRTGALTLAGVGLATAAAAYGHWLRFHVPITVAAGAIALLGTAVALGLSAAPELADQMIWIALGGGLAIFALAMWWDGSDRERLTRRSDVAFWLHLAAAPLIAHPIFQQVGVLDGDLGAGAAGIVLALYVAFAIVALAIDRRALLVSSLVYVLYALSSLFSQFGAGGINVALTALVIGSALLMLSAFWHPVRKALVGALPADLRERLPVSDRLPTPRPA